MSKLVTSHYHQRPCCTECDWWHYPSVLGVPGPTVCPDCGIHEIKLMVGQMLYKEHLFRTDFMEFIRKGQSFTINHKDGDPMNQRAE